jgi:hypothetical protein
MVQQLKKSSADAWRHINKGFSEAYKELYDAWEMTEKEVGFYKLNVIKVLNSDFPMHCPAVGSATC